MKIFFVTIIIVLSIFLFAFTNIAGNETTQNVHNTVAYFKKQATLFASDVTNLCEKVNKIQKNDPNSILVARAALKKCRLDYKSIEFFLTYFFPSTSQVYNQPNRIEVEEPFMEYHEPSGLQVLESLLFVKNAAVQKEELVEQASLIQVSASDLNSLLYNLKIDDKQILESLRLELVRIMTLGITGFDAPELKTGIPEAEKAMESLRINLGPFLTEKSKEADSVQYFLNASLQFLSANGDFDSFDRLGFLVNVALPLQDHLGRLIKERGLEINTTEIWNYNAKNLFSPDALMINQKGKANPQVIRLGQELFFDKGLSENNRRSCASCHRPDSYFTDQLPKSKSLDGLSTVGRNTPTLLYVSYQYAQFWDARVKSLDEQIRAVMANPVEMGSDHKIIVRRLQHIDHYAEAFKKTFPQDNDTAINMRNITLSIGAFMQTLAPFSSPFDRYINGDRAALTLQQVRGFNLFMGKAQCGTCHFPPIFNGLLPPLYKRTELEALGVTKTADFKNAQLDTDSGRYKTFPIKFYNGVFKTPTIRNSFKTAPYMHNGAFPTLESVLNFYNKGGGIGLGLKAPVQTLSPKPLKLKDKDIRDIIAFLKALTDVSPDYTGP